MQCFMRSIFAFVVIAGLFTPQVAANEGGDGGNDASATQQGGGAKTKKQRANCERLETVKILLETAKREAASSRKDLAKARDDLDEAQQSKGPGKSARVKKAQGQVRLETFSYENWLRVRDERQREYDKLQRACL